MTGLLQLLLPIVLSAVAVFIASSIIHMTGLWHKNDYPKVPNEDKLRAAVGPLGIPPGEYMVPRPTSSQEMKSPEFAEKVRQGPVLILTVLAPGGMMNMKRNLSLWFVYCFVVSKLAALVAGATLGPGADGHDVFHVIALTAFGGYVLALWQMWIWYGRSIRMTLLATLDAVIYALVTAGVFVWLWPTT